MENNFSPKAIISASELRAKAKAKAANSLNNVSGTPIFTQADVEQTTDIFARIVRQFCVENNITEEEFTLNHQRYAEDICLTPDQISQNRNNFKKTFTKDTCMTKNAFIKFCAIMNLDLIDLTVTIKDSHGKIAQYSLSGNTIKNNVIID